jgi:polygalacturonase
MIRSIDFSRVLLTAFFVGVGGIASAKDYDVLKEGAVTDGKTLNTEVLQRVIDQCAASGGGTVHVPKGNFLTGTLQLKSKVTLDLDKDACLLGSTDAADYKNVDPFIDGSGNPMGHALIVAMDATKVGIIGEGRIDGDGRDLAAKQKPYAIRPFLLRFIRCKEVMVKSVRLEHPGAWTLNMSQTDGAIIDGITIRSREPQLRNTDGVNLDSCENIQVKNCDVISGDDALVIKSTSSRPSRNITAEHCKLSTRTNAIKLGTESLGGFENIRISDCEIRDTKMAGIALYAVDGGDLKNVTIQDVTMDGVSAGICVRLGARMKTFREGDRPKSSPGKLKDILIKNVSAKKIAMVGILVSGVPGHEVENLTLEHVRLELPGGGSEEDAKIKPGEKEAAYPEFDMFGKKLPAYGAFFRHVRGLTLRDVEMKPLKPDARPASVSINVK